MRKLWNLIKLICLAIIIAFLFYLIPDKSLNVGEKYQNPDFPNGCEITALQMLMNYNNINISKDIINDYLPKSGFSNADPELAYIGNPRSSSDGFYCYAGPIVQAANSYFKDNGIDKQARDKTGMNILLLFHRVAVEKQPVAVWFTTDYKSPEESMVSYTDKNGNKNKLYKNLHCVVVEGMGLGKVKIVDPIKGKQSLYFWQFIKIYYQMGQRAIIIK
ncbi:C39 family peptidase [Peptostreptococcus equinus]|uniref:C39 family peptidase n=1 Tax=Peptostreptococcus equinus TaxID=3003601 RepID=A0ABY7JS97_9FIRM|nr:C39 family peptidase [Peptostreptococcus sp. CBA3647]WAW15038.1 C39 family peptidase [Peptostreptococcus sp. CBA3647]